MAKAINTANKSYPDIIKKEVEFVLSKYPELERNPIDFEFRTGMKKSFMQAQPRWGGVFMHAKKRGYLIKMTPIYHLEGVSIPIEEISSEVIIGWLAHELGHVMDYHHRSGISLIGFGLGYLLSKKYFMKAERVADTEAVNHGLGDYILATKEFILNHAHISDKYKERINHLYMSPDAVMEVIEKHELNLPKE